MSTFLFEVGTEELPARFLADAEKSFFIKLQSAFEENGLTFSGAHSYSTPRRLVLYFEELAETSLLREDVILGPSIKVSFDIGGRPTQAALGFARGQGVNVEDTFTLENERGSYIAVKKTSGGTSTKELLPNICSQVLRSLSFPKKMHWGDYSFAFARPLRWIACLFGNDIIPFSIDAVHSGRETYGHRVHGAGPFSLTNAEEYLSLINKEGHVVLEKETRLQIIQNVGTQLAAEKNGHVLWNNALLEEVQGLCEYPVPILGSFAEDFLEIPREVLLTSMESHQKSFGVETHGGKLLPYFLTVLNIQPENLEQVRLGWEKVLLARLEDARFFWKTDLASSFDAWLHNLESVIFLSKLGSMADKTRRIEKNCEYLASLFPQKYEKSSLDVKMLMKAGRFSKADLVSEMVKEFPSLQGIMGGIYANKFGESPELAQGIQEHYLPAGPDSEIPKSLYGCLVSIADKVDTLVGCFALGLIPSGAADPYGLRRATLGLVRIMSERRISIDVYEFFLFALKNYGENKWNLSNEEILQKLMDFYYLRAKNYFIGLGYKTLFVEACLAGRSVDLWSVSQKIEALTKLSETKDFEPTVLTFKRLSNIVKKQVSEGIELTGTYDKSLFAEDAETFLSEEYEKIRPLLVKLQELDDYHGLLALIVPLKNHVEFFFDNVMVLCDDEALRKNRLNLLFALLSLLEEYADFSCLQV